MSLAALAWLIVASLLLLAAHVVRAVRWSFLFSRKRAGADRIGLLVGLGIGYAVNALIPLRLGELLRAAVASRLRRTRFPETLATIVGERVADLLVLSLLIAATWRAAARPVFALETGALFAGVAALALIAAVAVIRSAALRRAVWRAAGVFNPRLRLALADFVWSSAEVLAGRTLLRWRFVVTTVAMWALYATAYAAFGQATGVPLARVVEVVLQHPLASFTIGTPAQVAQAGGVALYVFVLAPVLLILLLDPLARRRPARPLLRVGQSGRASHEARSDRFTASGYEDFLDALFSDARRAVSGFGMRAVDDCVVHRFYQGGSDALAALVQTDGRLLVRKFAMGQAADRLRIQADWLRRHAGPALPLVQVLGDRRAAGAYSYDMPAIEDARDFHDAIHSAAPAENERRLRYILGRIDTLHGDTAGGNAPDALVARYIADKIVRNAALATDFARAALGGDGHHINGAPFDLAEWGCLTDSDWLLRQFRARCVATIHGDLTVENVIVAPSEPHGLYLIDPNPENIFDTPLIDWAKMMQSLHLGYEALNRGAACAPVAGALHLPIARSEAYAALHATLEAEVAARFGEDGVREVYLHEIVHYLRLTPYKIRQSGERGLAFFACTSLLLRRFQQRFA